MALLAILVGLLVSLVVVLLALALLLVLPARTSRTLAIDLFLLLGKLFDLLSSPKSLDEFRLNASQSAAPATAGLNWGIIGTVVPTLLVPCPSMRSCLLSIGIRIVALVILLLIALIASIIVLSRTPLVACGFSLRVVSTLLAVVSIALI